MLEQLTGFIKGPFIIEGVIIGIISTILSLIILVVGYELFILQINSIANGLTVINEQETKIALLPMIQMIPLISSLFFVLAVGLGVTGSVISTNKYLDV